MSHLNRLVKEKSENNFQLAANYRKEQSFQSQQLELLELDLNSKNSDLMSHQNIIIELKNQLISE